MPASKPPSTGPTRAACPPASPRSNSRPWIPSSIVRTPTIDRLADYAHGIRLGKHPRFPRPGSTEIADLGLALRRMQEALEGRQYAEEYVQTLTHELKSPLSAIRGAAELLQEGMPRE